MKPVGGAKISLASSPDERQKIKNYLLYLHFIVRSFLCINCDDSVLIVQNTRRRKVFKQRVRP